MFFRVVLSIAIALLTFGTYRTVDTLLFVSRSVRVQASVIPEEAYRGPPRAPQSIPLHVRFTMPDGAEHDATIPNPFLAKVRPEDRVPLLVDTANLDRARLPLLSELWAFPFGLLAGGLGLLIVAFASRSVRPNVPQKTGLGASAARS